MNQPLSEPYQKGNLLTQVHEGMKVYDREDKQVGTVETVYISEVSPEAARRGLGPATAGNQNQPGTSNLLQDFARVFQSDQVPDALQRRLLENGFIRVDAPGLLAADRYVLPEQVARVSNNRVVLNVSRQDLVKR